MNLGGRSPFGNVLCYQSRAPVPHKACPILPLAMEGLRQRCLLPSQAVSGEAGRVSSTEGVHVFLFRYGYCLQKHFQVWLDREEESQVFATPLPTHFSPLVFWLVCCLAACSPLQYLSASDMPCLTERMTREKIRL